jgi:protein-tyrosine phosphatase
MLNNSDSREINFEAITNFRDLGGYRAVDGCQTAWQKLFRSGALYSMTTTDQVQLKEKIKLNSVIDLRIGRGLEQQHEIHVLKDIGIKYFNVPFMSYRKEELNLHFSNMGEVYLFRIGHTEYVKRIIEAMRVIAEPANHPLLFHCGAGKDRTGLLAAFILSVLGVFEVDIIKDYSLSAPYMKDIISQVMNDPETPDDIRSLPSYTWEAAPESMELLLSTLKREYETFQQYVIEQGAELSLINQLKKNLLQSY